MGSMWRPQEAIEAMGRWVCVWISWRRIASAMQERAGRGVLVRKGLGKRGEEVQVLPMQTKRTETGRVLESFACGGEDMVRSG